MESGRKKLQRRDGYGNNLVGLRGNLDKGVWVRFAGLLGSISSAGYPGYR